MSFIKQAPIPLDRLSCIVPARMTDGRVSNQANSKDTALNLMQGWGDGTIPPSHTNNTILYWIMLELQQNEGNEVLNNENNAKQKKTFVNCAGFESCLFENCRPV